VVQQLQVPPSQLREAAQWVAKQGESSQAEQVKFIAAQKEAEQIGGNILAASVVVPRRSVDWLEEIAGVNHPAVRLLGVKYLITDRKLEPATRPTTAPAPAPTRRLFGREPTARPMGPIEWKAVWPTTQPSGGVMVYENVAQPLPQFWIARNAEYVSTAKEALERVKKADFDPHEVVIVDREGTESGRYEFARRLPMGTGRGSPQILEDSPERIRIATEGAGGWLVLADAFAPGWRATMPYTASARGPRRGRVERTYETELTIVPAYGALRAVALRGGAEIVFEYEPKGWKNGLMVAGIGAIVLLLMIGGMMFPNSRQ